jgi:hypothetical protein
MNIPCCQLIAAHRTLGKALTDLVGQRPVTPTGALALRDFEAGAVSGTTGARRAP